ncbi:MAG TPA: hypothetical protein VL400_02085 [Polyangiaceae bacterium]|jgi:hypothetical protein|nr:hypothetical protein [Polyangiaceae bacterium]
MKTEQDHEERPGPDGRGKPRALAIPVALGIITLGSVALAVATSACSGVVTHDGAGGAGGETAEGGGSVTATDGSGGFIA